MTNHKNSSLEKNARLIVLMKMQDKGRLKGLSLQQIANLFPVPPHRMTIMRDLRDLDNLRRTIGQMTGKK